MSYLWELCNDCFQDRPGLSGEMLLGSSGTGAVVDKDECFGRSYRPHCSHKALSDVVDAESMGELGESSDDTSDDEDDINPEASEAKRRRKRKCMKKEPKTSRTKKPIETISESINTLALAMTKALTSMSVAPSSMVTNYQNQSATSGPIINVNQNPSAPTSSADDNAAMLRQLLQMHNSQQEMLKKLTASMENEFSKK